MIKQHATIRLLGLRDYIEVWQAMRHFTDKRGAATSDEFWVLEHTPVFTQGQNGKAEHVLNPGSIPVIQTDRGGQITYHGPGQLMLYTLIDLKRHGLSVRGLVTLLEKAVVAYLAQEDIEAHTKCEAPGIYLNDTKESKICSIGLRIRKGCSLHGIALNVLNDLEPFSRINPCGFAKLSMTRLSDHLEDVSVTQAGLNIMEHLKNALGYTNMRVADEWSIQSVN